MVRIGLFGIYASFDKIYSYCLLRHYFINYKNRNSILWKDTEIFASQLDFMYYYNINLMIKFQKFFVGQSSLGTWDCEK